MVFSFLPFLKSVWSRTPNVASSKQGGNPCRQSPLGFTGSILGDFLPEGIGEERMHIAKRRTMSVDQADSFLSRLEDRLRGKKKTGRQERLFLFLITNKRSILGAG
jgi:hypothetical protein